MSNNDVSCIAKPKEVWTRTRLHCCRPRSISQTSFSMNANTSVITVLFISPSDPLGLRVEQELVTSYPQVVLVRVPTPWVQSDSDITVLRHLEKMGCRLINRPQAILNCVNKFWTFQELAGHGVPLPDTFSYGKCVLNPYFSYNFDVHSLTFS